MKQSPESEYFIKPTLGADEMLNGDLRYCLWIEEQTKEQAYLIDPIRRRINAVEKYRLESKRKTTNKLAKLPWRFGEVRHINAPLFIIPGVSSEQREYIPMDYISKETVVTNSAFVIYSSDFWLVGLIMSKMHNLWVRAVGGTLESRLRYSATLCYNTFPFPRLTDKNKIVLEKLSRDVLLARASHTEMALGDMYNPKKFPQDLRDAHHALDLAVERCYREKPFESDEERLEFLFKQYIKLTTEKSTLWKI